ncbi:MAG: hypothetical protein QM783_05870 [Phycisphaerales bacterium]
MSDPRVQPEGGGGGGGGGVADAPSWFSDEISLLGEVRRAVVSFGDAPAVPGYSSLLRLKAGGQAVVYGATQVSTGRRAAIKIVRADDDRARARFRARSSWLHRCGIQTWCGCMTAA